MTEAEVEAKFRDMAGLRLEAQQCETLLAAVRRLDESNDVRRDLVPLLTRND
jgi:hypothetical protein